MSRVLFYTKKDCPLCDKAQELLDGLSSEYDFTLEKVDITLNEELFLRYRHAVPVIVVGDDLTIEAPITEERLRWALNRASGHQPQVTGKMRDFVIALDRLIFHFVKHWLLVFNLLLGLYVGLPALAPVLMASGAEGAGRLIYTIYKPMCHQLPWRSFFLFGEQPYYDRDYLVSQVGQEPLADIRVARNFLGTPELGYKMAFCERDMAIYGGMLLAGMLFGLLRKGLKPLPWAVLVLFMIPMAVDGGGQLVGLWESTPLSRVLSGGLFGAGAIWLAYPYFELGMRDIQEELRRKFGWT
ncbi:MAG: hypothetical protein B6I34_03210 [Anaerolineaceae bacterium 4572_32.1]|nr:MAG: hypothetical protein B6I34_03210 [Anaerolineaceae bacterium 4572_32.1]